ncbi:hypothetical protein PPTG_05884 [Phytophthora nicotianae INRA-310]|uniref:Uncharacterized protein n=1 Tax=Phytophthora nicotianae (strain INRA-310) TaxID=761204 RepID=W2QUG5_PHYN3|nr:hypothetical protein PPTG_05884 [Phytophthora nicotianae INRA-310]ETN16748.1 hypothetical protein PPTG_05884 [Phytophthora nicotianae INRA-310]
MSETRLTRELASARLKDLAEMKKRLDKMRVSLEKITEVQIECLARIEEEEEPSYQLAAALIDGDGVGDGFLSFGILLEMAVNRLTQ